MAIMPIRRDLCDEARRLARMLAAHAVGDVPAVHALLALMCFHGARFDARVALDGAIVLLEEQDRSAWNWSDVREGMAWLARSAAGDELTRYHVEAGIAWEHCRAPTFADTDWRRIAELYETLDRIAPSPAALAQPRGRRSVPARPRSRPRAFGRRSSGKRSRSLSWLARGEGRALFPPRPTLRRTERLAGSPTHDHCPRRSRILASPPRRLPARHVNAAVRPESMMRFRRSLGLQTIHDIALLYFRVSINEWTES